MAYGLPAVGPPRRPVRAAAPDLSTFAVPAASPAPAATAVRPEPTRAPALAGFGGGFSARRASRDILQKGINAGALDPETARRIARRRALANYINTRRRGRNASSLYAYGDPYAARSAAINSDIEASRGLGQELTNADLSSYGSYQDLIARLLSSERGSEEAAAQRRAEERMGNRSTLGQLAGAGVSALIPRI